MIVPLEYNKNVKKVKAHKCPKCGLHYEDEAIAKQCEAFCKEHNSCSLEITKLSVERTKNK